MQLLYGKGGTAVNDVYRLMLIIMHKFHRNFPYNRLACRGVEFINFLPISVLKLERVLHAYYRLHQAGAEYGRCPD